MRSLRNQTFVLNLEPRRFLKILSTSSFEAVSCFAKKLVQNWQQMGLEHLVQPQARKMGSCSRRVSCWSECSLNTWAVFTLLHTMHRQLPARQYGTRKAFFHGIRLRHQPDWRHQEKWWNVGFEDYLHQTANLADALWSEKFLSLMLTFLSRSHIVDGHDHW